MWQLIIAGGWVMLPLMIFSILTLAIIGEKCWQFRRRHIMPASLSAKIDFWFQKPFVSDKEIHLLKGHSPLGMLLGTAIETRLNTDVMHNALQQVGKKELARLAKRLNVLSMITAAAPLLGLLGTVIGMIKVFAVLELQGAGHAQALAGGISQALITTAAGLIIAISSLLALRFFESQLAGFSLELESLCDSWVNQHRLKNEVALAPLNINQVAKQNP